MMMAPPRLAALGVLLCLTPGTTDGLMFASKAVSKEWDTCECGFRPGRPPESVAKQSAGEAHIRVLPTHL